MTTLNHEPKRPPVELQAWALDSDGKVRTGIFASVRLANQWAEENGLGVPITRRLKTVIIQEVNERVGNKANSNGEGQ